MYLKNSITSYIDEQQRCMTLLKSNSDKINDICNQLLNARNKRKNIFVFGNGGSGSTASHFVSDLLKTAIVKKEKRFKAMSLTDNMNIICDICTLAAKVKTIPVFRVQLQLHSK